MSFREFAELVKKMRESQKRLISGERMPEVVAVVKDWERRVDGAVKDVLNPPAPTLLDDPPAPGSGQTPNPWDRH